MARRDNSPAISFFSFQDIITSLTGIMFLIVLLLVIIMSQMRPGKNNVPDPATAEMQARIAANAAELQTLRKAVKQMADAVKKLKKLDLDTVSMRCFTTRREVEKLQMELAELPPEIAQDTAKLQAVRQRNQALKQTLAGQRQSVRQQQAELQKLQKAQQSAEQKLRDRRRLARLAVENRTDLDPVLVECRKDGIRLLEIRSGKVTDLRSAGSSREEQIRALKNTLSTRDRAREYYTLLVAPEAFEYAVLTGADLGIREDQRGLEFYPDDRTTVFAETEP